MNFIKKHDNIIIFILTFIIALPIALDAYVLVGDELWNFQNVYKMWEGYQIYNDANVIITPLFYIIGNIMFHIFGASLFTFRIYNALIISSLMLVTYVLLKELDIKRKLALLGILLIFYFIIYDVLIVGANYNMLALVIYIFGVYLILKLNRTKKYYIIMAIITYLIFMTKQNIGIFFAIAFLINELINKDRISTKIYSNIIYIVTIGIFGVITIVIMQNIGILYNFINYCFLGLEEFSRENIGSEVDSLMLIISDIAICVAITVFLLTNKKTKNIITQQEKEKLKIMLIFSIILPAVAYPIINEYHVKVGIYLCIIDIIYIIKIMYKNLDVQKNRIIKIIIYVIISVNVIVWLGIVFDYVQEINKSEYIYEELFWGLPENKDIEENIDIIVPYIENCNEEVIVFSPSAVIYNVVLQRSNGIYDLPFKGNFGSEGEDGIIEDIKNKKDTIFLIENDETKKFYQESDKIKNYIKQNLKEDGTIGEYIIYKTN